MFVCVCVCIGDCIKRDSFNMVIRRAIGLQNVNESVCKRTFSLYSFEMDFFCAQRFFFSRMELKFLECIVLQLVHWQEVDFHYQRTKMKFCLFLMKKRRKKTQNREGKCFYFHRSNINCIVIAQTAEIVIQYPTIAMRPSICNQN